MQIISGSRDGIFEHLGYADRLIADVVHFLGVVAFESLEANYPSRVEGPADDTEIKIQETNGEHVSVEIHALVERSGVAIGPRRFPSFVWPSERNWFSGVVCTAPVINLWDKASGLL